MYVIALIILQSVIINARTIFWNSWDI